MRLLLDTNVVVWLLLGDRQAVSDDAVALLSDGENPVAVSAVSVWEIAIKRSVGKLTLPDGWSRALTRLDFAPLPITAMHAEQVERLPWHHRDPFDRLLIAQAQVEGQTIVTADADIPRYDVATVW
ncbi:MAG: type II toxin-antitoxin system VapC family toxin [Patulibacter minatonensis]